MSHNVTARITYDYKVTIRHKTQMIVPKNPGGPSIPVRLLSIGLITTIWQLMDSLYQRAEPDYVSLNPMMSTSN